MAGMKGSGGTLKVSPSKIPLIALVPARGGSKGIKGKNLQPVAGQPLVVHAIRLCQTVTDRVIVSTDDAAIAAVARFSGAEVVGRPDELADDKATVDDVCRWLATVCTEPARLLVVQPTVPQVRPADLVAMVADFDGDAWVAAVEARHITWQDGLPITGRANRQEPLTWPMQEIGVRLYAPGCWGDHPSFAFPFRGPVVDVDTPADLAAVRADLESKMIVFRVAGNHQVGSGHLHRCLALAERLQHHQIGFVPVQSDGLAESLLRKHRWPVWNEVSTSADLIVNDTLDTTLAGMATLRGVAPVLALEDLGAGAALASRVVNDMYGGDGARYAVVRPEFCTVPDKLFDGGRVLVTFGGTDPARLTERVARLLTLHHEIRVVDPPGRDGVWRNLAEDMAWADVVVTSGGRTVWEATAARRPCVTLLQNVREASHQHLTLGAGVINLGLGALVDDETVVRTVRRLAAHPLSLADLASRMKGVVDGRGADRIVAECERLMRGL